MAGHGRQRLSGGHLLGAVLEHHPRREGLRRLFRQFSFPGGIPSHAAPETPGSINEGGELGYSLAHAYGAAFDNPGLAGRVCRRRRRGRTGPLATAWHSNKFLNPVTDGAVLPILHLNGYKIANPTVLARISRDELQRLFEGLGYHPYVVEGDEPMAMHQLMAATLDQILDEISSIQTDARRQGAASADRPRWPVLILRSPKGWTGPKVVDGLPMENTWRAHQVPLAELASIRRISRELERWLRSYQPEELFDADGSLRLELASLPPTRQPAHERQPARERRRAAARPAFARFHQIRHAG